MNMNQVLDWVKKNLTIVILVVVMVAAVIAIPLWASQQGEAIREKNEQRARMASEIRSLAKTTFEDPVTGETQNLVVNEALLRDYERVVAAKREDAEQVRSRAVEFNRDDHRMITPPDAPPTWMFPTPPEDQIDIRPKQFHELLVAAYHNLLDEINAGTPPNPATLAEELKQKREQFILHSLSKTADQSLTEQEQQKLTEELREFRLGRYQEVANTISMYADFATLNVPEWQQQSPPSLAEAFQWQWRYWIFADVLRGLSRANADARSVLQAPVKRVLAIRSAGAPSVESASTGGGSGGGGGGAMGRGGRPAPGPGGALGGGGGGRRPSPGMSGGRSASDGGAQGGGGTPINPNQPVPIDYSVSLTGRTTNHLYDVRYVQLSIIADTKRLPQIINALAAQNFITVLDMNMRLVDPFAHVAEGYMYGSGTLSEVNMVLETIWLREWTSENMPADLKRSLGIPIEQPGSGQGGPSDQPQQ